MRLDPRRVFKWPRNPLQWPRDAYILVVGLVVAVALVLWLVILARPSEFPPTDVPNQSAAEAAIMGGGALFVAAVATGIATVAFTMNRPTFFGDLAAWICVTALASQ